MKLKSLMALVATVIALVSCTEENYFMNLSQKQFQVGEDGGNITVDLEANVYYRVVNNNDFISIELLSQDAYKTTYSITVNSNNSNSERKARIKFIGDYVTPLALDITQDAKVPVGISKNSMEVLYDDTEVEFTVLGNKEWSAVSNNPAFVLSKNAGRGETVVKVTFPENESNEDVVATITVTIDSETYKLVITQKSLAKIEYTDLSEKATSNCYLVQEAGFYKFKVTVKGNGVVPESQGEYSTTLNPTSVKVIWSTFNTDTAPANNDALITELSLEDGYVKFKTADNKDLIAGSVLIGAVDATNTIIWSWHIWLTKLGNDVTISTVKWMDRNLGALSPNSYQTINPLACGFHYQWGRKDPFMGTTTFTENEKYIATTATFPAPILVSETVGSIDYAIKNPLQFIYVSGSSHNNKDWLWAVQYNDLWGGKVEANAKLPTNQTTVKTMFDPCPVGYCVPTSYQYYITGTTEGIDKNLIDTAHYGVGTQNFWLTYPGSRLYDSGNLGGPVGGYSWYATSSTNGINMLCTRSNTAGNNMGGATSARSCGYSVRCVKE